MSNIGIDFKEFSISDLKAAYDFSKERFERIEKDCRDGNPYKIPTYAFYRSINLDLDQELQNRLFDLIEDKSILEY